MEAKQLMLERINGHVKRPSGVYVPTKEYLKKVLEKAMVPPEENIPYVPHSNELKSLEIAMRTKQSVLLAGPTGVGKSMLARYIAQQWKLPFLWITCDPDKTEGKIMGRPDIVFATIDVNDDAQLMHMQQFRPSAISIAGLAELPVVLFIDELHKLRKDIDALFHPLVNERVVNLSDHLGPGEICPLHDETLVLFALNPYYSDGGIERVGPAMRQRLKTLYFPMLTDTEKMMKIVTSNLGDLKGNEEIIKNICEMCAAICRIYLEYRKEAAARAEDMEIKGKISNALPNISEAPSPRVIVNASRAIVAGQEPQDAILENIFNAITNDFGATAQALVSVAEDTYSIKRE